MARQGGKGLQQAGKWRPKAHSEGPPLRTVLQAAQTFVPALPQTAHSLSAIAQEHKQSGARPKHLR